jgi:hypothetical protein
MATGGSRELPSVMVVMRRPVRIHSSNRPAPRVGTLPGAACFRDLRRVRRWDECREIVGPCYEAAPLHTPATLLVLSELGLSGRSLSGLAWHPNWLFFSVGDFLHNVVGAVFYGVEYFGYVFAQDPDPEQVHAAKSDNAEQ